MRAVATLFSTGRLAMGFVTVMTLAACASTAPVPKQAPIAQLQREEGGFAIVEEGRIAAEARSDYDSATRMLEAKQYGPAIELLLKVTQSAPEATAAHVDLGMAYSRSGELDKAEASLKRALELNPSHPVAYNELGLVYRRKGEFDTARWSYEKALALSPEFHFARLNLAILCDLYLADLACALDNYVAYQQAVPDDRNAAIWIADLRSRTAAR